MRTLSLQRVAWIAGLAALQIGCYGTAYGGYAWAPVHSESTADFGGSFGIGHLERGRQRVAFELVTEGSVVPNRVLFGAGPGGALWLTPSQDSGWSAVARVRCPLQSDGVALVASPGLEVGAAYFPDGRKDESFLWLAAGVENHLYTSPSSQEALLSVRLGVGLTASNLH